MPKITKTSATYPVNLQGSRSEVILAGHQHKFMYIYRISLSEAILAGRKNHVNLQDFPFRGYAGRLPVRIHVNLQDFQFRGYAGRLPVRIHVNLQDFPFRG